MSTTDEVVDGEAVEVNENGEIVEERMPAVREPAPSTALVAKDEISIEELVKQGAIVEEAMRRTMKPDIHYGHIPGIAKPTLLKPGAEKLNVLFRLAPSYVSDKTWHEDGHLTVIAKCVLTHIPTGLIVAEGEGLCSTRESKYAFRQGKRTCPDCNAEAIVRSTKNSAYYCISNEGGCGHRFNFGTDKAKALDGQDVSRVPNPDLADSYNTVLKMADKRALLAAVLNGTAASDIFTQDLNEEDGATASGSETTTSGGRAPQQASREFQVDHDFLEGAIQGENWVPRLAEGLKAMYATIDWEDVLAQAVQAVWPDKGNRSDLKTDEEKRLFYTRLANTIEWITKASGGAEFPDESMIVAGFAYGFNNIEVQLTKRESDAVLTPEQTAEMRRLEEEQAVAIANDSPRGADE